MCKKEKARLDFLEPGLFLCVSAKELNVAPGPSARHKPGQGFEGAHLS